MNRRGRVSFAGLFGLLFVVLVVAVLFFSRESLTTIGNRFMIALQRGDVDTLTKMTYLGNTPNDEIRKQWDFAVNKAGKYYNFQYRVDSTVQNDAKTASIRMKVIRNSTSPGGYEENYQLPMIKVGDDWKVDVRGISREMYPALPQ